MRQANSLSHRRHLAEDRFFSTRHGGGMTNWKRRRMAALIFDNQGVNGQLAAGRNSLLVLGETSADRTVSLFKASGLHWGQDGVTAALSIHSPQHLDPGQGAIVVDGSLTSAPAVIPGTVSFGEGALLGGGISPA